MTDVNIKSCVRNYAAIDIGSNAVRLLVKRVERYADGSTAFYKMQLLRVPLRLGFDVFKEGRISDKKEKNMVRLMKAYRHLMKIYDVDVYRSCATSAMRDADNGRDIIKRIEKKTGIKIDILEGEEEARMIYDSHQQYMKEKEGNFMYVDVGGGSTEVNLLSHGQPVYRCSYNIGTVRMLNEAVRPEEWEHLRKDMTNLSAQYPGINIVGSGGNINKLYRLVEKKNKKLSRMSVKTLSELHDTLKVLNVTGRMKIFNLKPDRADVIVPAGEIFLTIASLTGAEFIYVPTIGLSDGIIDALYNEDLKNGR